MKLTPGGRNLLQGVSSAALLSWLLDARVTLLAALALALTALLSLTILWMAGGRAVEISLAPSRLRGFKGEPLSARLSIGVKARRWIRVHVAALQLPPGLKGTIEKSPDGSFTLNLTPLYAGRFRGLEMRVELRDFLNICSKPLPAAGVGLVLEALPRALLKPAQAAYPPALALGERPSGFPGSGQEFYGVDEYNQTLEAKHILWKRVAARPEQGLVFRIRESNIRKTVRLVVIENVERGMERAGWADLVCEATAEIGKTLIAMGCRMEVLSYAREPPFSVAVSSLDELADAVMEVSSAPSAGRGWSDILDRVELVVTGMREVEEPRLAAALQRKPVVLIREEASPTIMGEQAVIYTGSEDLSSLVRRVVGW